MSEVWKSIENYSNYEVSNEGNVRHIEKKKILKPSKLTTYHSQVKLYNDDGSKWWRIHRLVANAFIPNPENYPWIDHIDGNPLNNNVNNLRWCTPLMNAKNRKANKHTTTGLKGVSFKKDKYCARITSNKITYHIGYYKTKEEAHEAYKKKAIELFGEYNRKLF